MSIENDELLIQIEERELDNMETEQRCKWTLSVTKEGIDLKMKGCLCKEEAMSLSGALSRSADLMYQLSLGITEPARSLQERQFESVSDAIPGLMIKKKWLPSRKKKKRG